MSITFKEVAATKTGLVARFTKQGEVMELDQLALAKAIADRTAEDQDEFTKGLSELRKKKQI